MYRYNKENTTVNITLSLKEVISDRIYADIRSSMTKHKSVGGGSGQWGKTLSVAIDPTPI